MFDRPLQLLNRDQYLAETGIDLCFAAVEAAYPDYFILLFEDVLEESAQHLPTFRECSACPGFLLVCSSIDSNVYVRTRRWDYWGSEASAVCWTARKYFAILDLNYVNVQ